MIESSKLKIKLKDEYKIDNNLSIHVYARSYNYLRIMSGMGGIAFLE